MPASGLSNAVTTTTGTNISGAHREVRPAYLHAGFKGGSGSPAHLKTDAVPRDPPGAERRGVPRYATGCARRRRLTSGSHFTASGDGCHCSSALFDGRYQKN